MNKIVAIDGPAGSGKGTLASIVSKACNLVNIDTGATYRCVALKALRNNLKVEDKEEIIKLSENINVEFGLDGKVFLDGEDVTDLIRSKEVTTIVSPISSIVEVRKNMVELQRRLANNNDVIIKTENENYVNYIRFSCFTLPYKIVETDGVTKKMYVSTADIDRKRNSISYPINVTMYPSTKLDDNGNTWLLDEDK